jgi:plasmid stabilization system protein ParE
MGRRKIIWSHKARIKLFEILEYYAGRNQSKTYPAKLYRKFNKELKVLINHPDIGIKTDLELVRGLIVGDFILFYEYNSNFIIVHTIWDCRQNPEDLVIK